MNAQQVSDQKRQTIFTFWTDSSSNVNLVCEKKSLVLPMQKTKENFFCLETDLIETDDAYTFLLDENLKVPDPSSKEQSQDIHDASILTDPAKYQWKAKEWKGLDWENTRV